MDNEPSTEQADVYSLRASLLALNGSYGEAATLAASAPDIARRTGVPCSYRSALATLGGVRSRGTRTLVGKFVELQEGGLPYSPFPRRCATPTTTAACARRSTPGGPSYPLLVDPGELARLPGGAACGPARPV